MQAVQQIEVWKIGGAGVRQEKEEVVAEEPLEIRLGGRRYTATMRTPETNANSDIELALGLLLSEGIIAEEADVEAISSRTRCRERSGELVNVVDVTLHDDSAVPTHLWERSLISNASCGLCGKASVEAMQARLPHLPPGTCSGSRVPMQVLSEASKRLRDRQEIFARTGGLHGALLCDAWGRRCIVREDIGRHNATDKTIGAALREGWLQPEQLNSTGGPQVLVVSGRLSFEIVQKALSARVAIVAAVSAASSLAVDLASAHNQTLVGWLRDGRATVYCGHDRLEFEEAV